MSSTNNNSRKKTGKQGIDLHSIKFKLWAYFITFAVILLCLIWLLQIFFLNTYYEEMKSNETSKIANHITESFASNDYDFDSLKSMIKTVSSYNDLTIMVSNTTGAFVITSESSDEMGPSRGISGKYAMDIVTLDQKLASSAINDGVTNISVGRGSNRTMEFACYLRDKDDNIVYTLYIFSPLFPVQSTVNILRSQLVYITIIAILLSLALALYLANRISKPIKDITNSAAEMGKGNYSVKFKGGHYSETRELADTLTAAEGELEKTDMYQKDLIANVSHDLRTPLTMIKSYAEMIRDLSGNNPVKRSAHLNVIIEEADRLNSLVNDMLNLSRMQSKRIKLEKTKFDFCKAAASIMSSYDILNESDGYDIQFHCNGDEAVVYSDEAKIKQVMSNLINNAVKYCGADKQILVDLKKSGKNIRFSVTDHGKGIAPDEVAHVWEKYYKSSTHHVRPTDGSGLGLSIVKEILNLHKADFDVTSELNKGSTFWFELPILKNK